jgi:hypothetical protein
LWAGGGEKGEGGGLFVGGERLLRGGGRQGEVAKQARGHRVLWCIWLRQGGGLRGGSRGGGFQGGSGWLWGSAME